MWDLSTLLLGSLWASLTASLVTIFLWTSVEGSLRFCVVILQHSSSFTPLSNSWGNPHVQSTFSITEIWITFLLRQFKWSEQHKLTISAILGYFGRKVQNGPRSRRWQCQAASCSLGGGVDFVPFSSFYDLLTAFGWWRNFIFKADDTVQVFLESPHSDTPAFFPSFHQKEWCNYTHPGHCSYLIASRLALSIILATLTSPAMEHSKVTVSDY
jgi:hypothetical protein